MNEVLEYFRMLNNNPFFIKKIKVYGEKTYDYRLIQSITPYLFEDLKLKEEFPKPGQYNRPGNIKQKVYITIHDTGDVTRGHNATFWHQAVVDGLIPHSDVPYNCSFQYVIGNDMVWHNIPDNEVAYHAGDSTKVDYNLNKTGVKVKPTSQGIISIDDEGYYTIDNERTLIQAPKFEKDNEVKLCNESNICDQGLCLEVFDDEFYIGETYFNPTYEKIANRGGNNNSIGMEICIDEGCNIYYNLQQAAKLTAKLLKENDLYIYDIKQHHYFSGKNCPQTIRTNDLWEYFLALVQVELDVLDFIEEGYEIKLISNSKLIAENGTINNLPASIKGLSYKIITIKNGTEEDELSLTKLI